MEKKNNKIFKIIMIVLDVLAVLAMLWAYKNWVDGRKQADTGSDAEEHVLVTFNSLSFYQPEGINYSQTDEKTFILWNDDFQADFEIFIDENDNIEKYQDTLFYDQIRSNGFEIEKPYTTIIEDVPVIGYNYIYEDGMKAVFCYFKLVDSYWAEAVLFNEENTFDVYKLAPIIETFKTIEHDESVDDKDLYHHYEVDSE